MPPSIREAYEMHCPTANLTKQDKQVTKVNLEITNVRAINTDSPTTVLIESITEWYERRTAIEIETITWNG